MLTKGGITSSSEMEMCLSCRKWVVDRKLILQPTFNPGGM